MRLKGGDTCPKTGIYHVMDTEGRVVKTIYVGQGETMPSMQENGAYYVPVN